MDEDYSEILDQLVEKDIRYKEEQKRKEKEHRKKEQEQRLEKIEKLNLNKNGWYDEEKKNGTFQKMKKK